MSFNQLELIRYDLGWDDEGFIPDDELLVRIDGRDLSDLLVERKIDAGAGLIPTHAVAPPSRHWLGEPLPWLSEGASVGVLEGGCGAWQCCGVSAHIEISDSTVTWKVDGLDPFTFDRIEYERALAGVLLQTPRAPDWDDE